METNLQAVVKEVFFFFWWLVVASARLYCKYSEIFSLHYLLRCTVTLHKTYVWISHWAWLQFSWIAAHTWSASNLAMWLIAKCSFTLTELNFGGVQVWLVVKKWYWLCMIMPRAAPSLLTEAFHVSEWRPPSLIYMGFISLTPHLPHISLCVYRGSCERALHDLLQVAVCRVNTSNYRVPVQPWKDWTSMENQFDNYQVLENVIVQKRLGTYTQWSCLPTVFLTHCAIFLCYIIAWPRPYFAAIISKDLNAGQN